MKKILICTDSHVLHTGLAEVTRLIFANLLAKYKSEYQVVQIGFFHSNPIMEPLWQIIPTQLEQDPNGNMKFKEADRYGQLTYPNVVRDYKPDIVFGYGDPWYVNHMVNHKSIMNHAMVLYLTYDGIPYGDADQDWLKNVDQLVTCADFSKKVMIESMPKLDESRIEVLYHPADLARFNKLEPSAKAMHRKNLCAQVPENAFIMGWAGRNQWRKQVWKPYEILSYLRSGEYLICQDCDEITPLPYNPMTRKYIDTYAGSTTKFDTTICSHCKSSNVIKADPINDIYLWCHMAPEDRHWPVEILQRQFNLQNGEVIYTPNFSRSAGLDPNFMNILYNVWDLNIYLSGGEGFGLPCHFANTKVWTTDGFKNIESIKENDFVYSHTGNKQRVTGTTINYYNKEKISIKLRGGTELSSTDNHPWFISRRINKKISNNIKMDPSWVHMKDINIGDFFTMPKIKVNRKLLTLKISDFLTNIVKENNEIYYKMSFNQRNNNYSLKNIASETQSSIQSVSRVLNKKAIGRLKQSKIKVIENKLKEFNYIKPDPIKVIDNQILDEDLMTFFGLYLAEGNISAGGNAINIASHKDEIFNHELCKKIALRFNCSLHKKIKGNGVQMTLSSKVLAQFLLNLFSELAVNKKVPHLLLESDNLHFLIKGYFYGDGYFKRRIIKASSVSYDLIQFIKLALNTYGICSFSSKEKEVRNNANYINHIISIPSQYWNKFEALTQLRVKSSFSRKTPTLVLEDDNYFYLEVKSINKTKVNELVYNLHVENDESYLVEGFSSHNCFESIIAGTPSVATDYSAHGEIINNSQAGTTVPGILQPEAGSCIWRMIADTGKTIKAVRKYYFDRNLLLEDGKKGREFAMQHSTEIIADKWHSIFQKVYKPIRQNQFCLLGEPI